MATLATLRKQALGRYGLSRFGDEDPVFHQVLMTELVNEAHQWLAAEAKLYRKTVTANLPVASGGVSTVAVDAAMFEVDPEKVRILTDGTWTHLRPMDEDYALRLAGPLENADSGVPLYFWVRTGETAGADRQLVLYPGATTAVTSGLKYDGWVYPAELTADTDEPGFSSREHDTLLPAICWKMAEIELSRGRPDAGGLVTYWRQQAETACAELQARLTRLRTPGPRQVVWRPVDFF